MNAIFSEIQNFVSVWFSAKTPWMAFLEGVLFVIGIYGLLKVLLFLIRYYIIYSILKKVFDKFKGIKLKDSKYKIPPSNKEDEKLRNEKKEREAEKIEVEKLERKEEQEKFKQADFRIIIPKATGKWQKFILGQRQNILIQVAREMQASGSSNFWQAYIRAQRDIVSGRER